MGDQIAVWLTSRSFDARVTLYGPSGFIAVDDSSGGQENALIPTIVLREDGIYTVIVDTYSGTSGGNYQVLLQEGLLPDALPIHYGDAI